MDLLTDLAALICFLHLIVFSVSYPYYITFFFFFIGVFRGYHISKVLAHTFASGKLRAEKGIRSEDAAEVFGVSRATLSAYEMGKSVPDLNVLNKMADFYEVSSDYICGRTNVKKSLQTDTSSVKLSQSDVNKISELSDSETVGLSLLINSAQFKKMVKALAVCYISAFYLDYYNERESKRSIPAVKKELKSSKIGNVDRVIRNAVDDFFSELSYPILHYTFGGSELVCGEFQKNFSKEYVSLLGQSELSGTATLAQCVTQLVSQIYGMNFCPEKEELFDKTDEAIKSAVDEHIKELKEALRTAKRDDKSDAGEIALELKFFEAYRDRYFS
ncbi:MAG: helix-turn-helix domain-containing protein [Oscillospiraceae bacterium]